MTKATMNAIQNRINNGETSFRMGKYYYECNINGMIRRREQTIGNLPTSDWERVGSWNPATGMIER